MTKKWCGMCARFLPLEEFWPNRSRHDTLKLQNWCMSCHRAWRVAYREIERGQEQRRRDRLKALKTG